MKLQAYLEAQGLTYAAFARAIGTPHARTVERYAKGQRLPNRAAMAEIARVTEGAVTANDFHEAGQ